MLTIPNSKTVGVHVTINGKKEKVDLTEAIANIAPVTTVPGILDLINNTNAPILKELRDVNITALAKAKIVYSYVDGTLIVNPQSIAAEDAEIAIKMLKPFQIIDKAIVRDIDLAANGEYKTILAKRAANFIAMNKVNNEILAWNQLAYHAQATQAIIIDENPNATSFKNGAHVQKQTLKTAQDVKNAITDAKKVMTNIGSFAAATIYDKNNKFVEGIDIKNDTILIIDESIKDRLMELPGLTSSDKGFEMFKLAELEKILGITTYATSRLPKGVNFLLITTGNHGAYAHNLIGDGYWASIEPVQQWRKDMELQQAVSQFGDVVYDSYIIASFDDATEINLQTKINEVIKQQPVALTEESYSAERQTMMGKVVDSVKNTFNKPEKNEDIEDTNTGNINTENPNDQVS